MRTVDAGGLVELFLAGRKATTRRAYAADLAAAVRFLRGHGVPGDEDGVVLLGWLGGGAGPAHAAALAWRSAMVDQGLAPATVNRRLAALRSVVRLAGVVGLINWRLAIEGVDRAAYRDTAGPGRDGWLALLDLARRRGDAKGLRDLAMLRLMHDVGLRRGEVIGLDLEHVDRRRRQVLILGKGRTAREGVTLPAPTMAALDAWIERRGSWAGPLFHGLDRAGAGGRLSGEAVRLIVRGLGAAVGLTVRPHGLRHQAVTEVLDLTGGDIRRAQRFARHADPKTTMHYDDNRRDLAGEAAALIAED